MEREHKIEKEELNEDIWSFSDEPKNTFMDKKFVYNTYKLMTLEIEHPDYFMVINVKRFKNNKTSKSIRRPKRRNSIKHSKFNYCNSQHGQCR